MGTRTPTLLLLLLALALAIAPLRVAWAITDMAVTNTESHCVQADMQLQDSGNASSHDCKQGCDGNCCDGSCNSCVHFTSGISNPLTLTPAETGSAHTITIPFGFSVRAVIPLLRPPVSL